jgi:hypothetical protein
LTWTYVQRTGSLNRDGTPIATGYSGNTTGLNNPDAQDKVGVGPVPCGKYTIGPPHQPVDHLGPDALPLYPAAGNKMHGRSAFFIHGDNSAMNHPASNGCIILGHLIRKQIEQSHDKDLLVTAD